MENPARSMAETCQKESGQAGLSVNTTYSASPNAIKAGGTETQVKSQKEHPFCPRRFVLGDLSIKVFTIGFKGRFDFIPYNDHKLMSCS